MLHKFIFFTIFGLCFSYAYTYQCSFGIWYRSLAFLCLAPFKSMFHRLAKLTLCSMTRTENFFNTSSASGSRSLFKDCQEVPANTSSLLAWELLMLSSCEMITYFNVLLTVHPTFQNHLSSPVLLLKNLSINSINLSSSPVYFTPNFCLTKSGAILEKIAKATL